MQDLILYLEKAKAADESINSFSEVIGNVPTPWEKGDIITFPNTIEGNAFKTKIGNKKYEYIVVHVKSANGNERQANFFPSLFRRRARRCEYETVDGVEIAVPTNEFVVAGGSIVSNLYSQKAKMNEVITSLLGKSIVISAVTVVDSNKFGTNEPDTVKVYDFEPEGWTIGDAPVDIPEDTTTDPDAIKVIENTYGNLIDECLKNRDYSMPVLAIGLPFSVFGNRMVLKFVKSSDENDIEWRFYYHYSGFCLNVLSKDNASIRRRIIKIIYDHFYESRFKKNE